MSIEESKLDRAIDYAMSQASEVGDVTALPDAVRTVALVHAAQGIIDNGGLQYLFEADFPGNPPYALFLDAYRAIGAQDAAAVLERAVALFPFANPHRHVDRRNEFMDRFGDDDNPFEALSKSLCGDDSIWSRLGEYVEKNAGAFRPVGKSRRG